MSLGAKVIEVRERAHTSLRELFRRDFTVLVRVHDIKYGADDMVCLLAVRSFVRGLLL